MKKKRTFLLAYLAAASALSVIVRYVQLIDVIDFNTGFFKLHAGIMQYLHYIVLGAALIGIIVLTLIEKRRKTRFFTKKMGLFDETDHALCGIMLILAGFAVIYTAFVTGFNKSGIMALTATLLGTAAYGFSGGLLLFRKKVSPASGLAFLFLSCYYVMRMVEYFLENHIILAMSEHLIRLLQMVLFALFYLSAGRMLLRAENKTTRSKVCIFGFFAAVIAISEILAKIVFWYGSTPVVRPSSDTQFIRPDMLMAAETIALTTFLFCMTRYKDKKVKKAVTEANQSES